MPPPSIVGTDVVLHEYVGEFADMNVAFGTVFLSEQEERPETV